MPEQAVIAPPAPVIETDADPFVTKMFAANGNPMPEPVAPPTPAPTPEPFQPPTPQPEPVTPATPTGDRPRGPDGKFLPVDAPKPTDKPEAPPEPKEDIFGKLNDGELTEIPALTKKNPGMRPEEGSEEHKTWKEQSNALKAERARSQELEARLKETEAKAPKDYEELKQRLETVSAREAARDVTSRPEFQQDFAIPMKNIANGIKGIIEPRGFSTSKIGEIMGIENDIERDEALTEYLSGGDKPLSHSTIARISIQVEQLRTLRAESDEVIKNAPKILEDLKNHDAEKEREAAEQEKTLYEKGKGLVFQVLESEFGSLMNNPKSREVIEKAAARTWNELKPAQRALAMASPAVVQELKAEMSVERAEAKANLEAVTKENASLRLQLAKYGGGGPSTVPSDITTPAPESDDPFAEKLGVRPPAR